MLPSANAPGKAPALLKVFGVLRVVGLGLPFELNMAFNAGAGQTVELEHAALAPPLDWDAEAPSLSRRGEVFALPPGLGFLGVASGGPAPQLVENIIVHGLEGLLGGSIAIIVGPTAQQLVGLRFLLLKHFAPALKAADLMSTSLIPSRLDDLNSTLIPLDTGFHAASQFIHDLKDRLG